MKHLVVIAAVVLFVTMGLVFAQDNPFMEIKGIALGTVSDKNGDYILERHITKNGSQLQLVIGYFPSVCTIGIVIFRGEQAIITIYRENDNIYEQAFARGDDIISSRIITEEEARAVARLVLPYFKGGIKM